MPRRSERSEATGTLSSRCEPSFAFQVAYPAIIQSAFGLFSCKTLADDSSTFLFAQHLDCNSDEAHVARAVAAASLAIWGVGFPLFLGAMVYRFSDNPNYSFVIVSFDTNPICATGRHGSA